MNSAGLLCDTERPRHRPFLIGVSGGTASGKVRHVISTNDEQIDAFVNLLSSSLVAVDVFDVCGAAQNDPRLTAKYRESSCFLSVSRYLVSYADLSAQRSQKSLISKIGGISS